ncbi:hypothetical protein FB451DRAFT_698912 [Mycena latifolia]|nr:hypothetical protein FB451DRAFT_698912 [Mycena latifolia]
MKRPLGSTHEIIKSTSAEEDLLSHMWGLLNISQIGVATNSPSVDLKRNLERAKEALTMLRNPTGIAYCELSLADLALREGDTQAAQATILQYMSLPWESNTDLILHCLEKLADVTLWSASNIGWSSNWMIMYLVYTRKLQDKFAFRRALRFLGDMFMVENDEITAQSLFIVALEGFSLMDVHRSRAECMLRLGDIAKRQGDLSEAVNLWKEARPLFERSMQGKEVVQIDTRLAAADTF